MDDPKTTAMAGQQGTLRAQRGEGFSLASSAGLIYVGYLIEPELLAGMVIGAGIVFASGLVAGLVDSIVRPVVKTAVKAGYSAASGAREMVAEVSQEIQGTVAEARAEHQV